MNKKSISPFAQAVGVVVFVALLLASVVSFVTIYSADPYRPPVKLSRDYDRSAMNEAMSPEAVSKRFDEIIALGSRAPGQEGLGKAADMIERTFREAGLEVFTQDVHIPYALADGGKGTLAIGGETLDAWPFYPNYTQPVVTPAEGLEGELFLVTEENVRKAKVFSDKIAVIDLSKPVFEELGLNPAQYIDLGFQGVLLTHSDGLDAAPWPQLADKFRVRNMPINLVRAAVGPEVLAHIGEKARLTAVSRWRNAATRNIVGVLHAGKKTDRALVITATYDATSLIPDFAQGPVQALNTALMLQMLKGIAPHRDALQRDVIFIATTGVSQTMYGTSRLLSTIGSYGKGDAVRIRIEGELADNARHVEMLAAIRKVFDDNPAFATVEGMADTEAILRGLPPETRKFFADRISAVMRRAVFDQSEVLLRAEIEYKRDPDNLKSPAFALFRKEKQRYDDLNNLSALPLARALERPAAKQAIFPDEAGKPVLLRDAILSHVDWLAGYHRERQASIERDHALQRLFAGYAGGLLVFSPHLQPAKADGTAGGDVENVGYGVGTFLETSANVGEPANLFGQLVNDSIYALGLQDEVKVDKPTGTSAFPSLHGGCGYDTNPWGVVSIPAFTLLSSKNSSEIFEHPFVQPSFTNLVSIRRSMRLAGEIATAAGRGYGNFGRLPFVSTYSTFGSVYASGVGNSVVPNYAVAGALVAALDAKPFCFTDPYGAYRHPFLTMPNYVWARNKAPEAFYFGRSGLLEYVKDYGTSAQNIYKSRVLPTTETPVNLILYRSTPVAVLNIVNPQSMKAFTGIQFISSSGLAAFSSTCPYTGAFGMMDFVPPKEYFFLTLKAGAPGNELVATTRAFCLGTRNNATDKHYKPTDDEIDGAGYLAADTPVVRDITAEADASMDWLAQKRLELQKRYGMADEMTLSLDGESRKLVDDDAAQGASRPLLARLRDLRQALSYQILNHPVIRGSVTEAVWGILWYMGLLVPFIFFFEKLVFGFTDIRKQVLAEGAIFLVVFVLLRILHPAFHMIRSSAMILLGFVIIIIVASVTSVLSTKFQENLDAMRASQGIVKGAQGNTFGIVMTAFMLGLNNMHRRKVRTGLTCATLVLMTFVMICFTSVQSNVVEKERATGRAAYQGILVREKQFRPISAREVDALNATYGEKHTVNIRQAHIGSLNKGSSNFEIPNFQVTFGEGDKAITRTVKAGIALTATEPLRDSIAMLTTNGWFTAEQAAQTQAPYPVILPDDVADQLGVEVAAVNAGPVPVKISGVDFYVWGIFRSADLPSATDVDGENLLPFDIEGISSPQISENYVLAEDSDPRVQPSDVLIGLVGQLPDPIPLNYRTVSVVVDMGSSPYATARQEINAYLIQTGRDSNYGLDGTAFNGRRARSRSMAGMADLIIPLIIAALTVLNTMKGSVYERKNEIFVYNAVGIAPRYIFFMFVAEALVYSVVGAVLGYILSQGTGRILTALNLTGGMNMNFTSVTTIYASLAIAAATLASTYFPARSAIEIAKPTDDAGWSLPEPDDDDTITFTLPFTFTHYDRIAVLSFFYNYFENLGEGSSGAFFSGPPRLTLSDETDPLAGGAYIPRLEVQVWLKPFDLGVSQRITIDLPTDPDTKEYISKMRLVRLTGTRDAWVRLNKPMVALIRQHFLHWRAVPKETKVDYFTQAKALLEESVLGEAAKA